VLPREGPSSSEPRGLSVLIIDDDPAVRESMALLLALDDHVVAAEGTSAGGFGRARSERFDVVIVDVRLFGDSPGSILAEIASAAPGLERRVIFVTGDVLSETTVDRLKSTGRPFLLKPFTAEALKAAVQRAAGETG
jgi:DNA-binding NtrC family response regulator